MPRTGLMQLRLGLSMILAFLVFCTSGCVVWLPDSSGFIYIEADKDKLTRVIHFDLATRKSRILMDKIEPVLQPGLSPDGKRIAVVKYNKPKKQASTLQMVVYSDQGKELMRSKEFEWWPKAAYREDPYAPPEFPSALYWGSNGQHILVCCDRNVGLFDLKAGTMRIFSEATVVNIAGSPIRPDGTGFLILKTTEMNGTDLILKFAFVNWQGKEQVLDTPPHLAQQIRETSELKGGGTLFMYSMLFAPMMHPSRWNKDVAEITACVGTLRIDLAKKEVRFQETVPLKTTDGKIIYSRYPLSKNTEVRTVMVVSKSKEKLPGIRLQPPQRVESILAGQKKPKVLVAEVQSIIALPSTDGEWLALWCVQLEVNPMMCRILLVNRKGEVIEVTRAEAP